MNDAPHQEQSIPFNIWEGIWENFKAARDAQQGGGFSSERYLQKATSAFQESFDALKSGQQIPLFHKQRFTLFPITVSLMLSQRQNSMTSKLRILDYGGGLGIGMLSCMENIPDVMENIDYTIVELPEISEIGEKLAKKHHLPITYQSELSLVNKQDLVFCSSALQYIEEWEVLIKTFAQTKAGCILLGDVFCGKFNTFATMQNYYESKIPHWFFSETDLVNEFMKHHYTLQLKSFASGQRAGIDDILPMSNFPKSHQLSNATHLLFTKENPT